MKAPRKLKEDVSSKLPYFFLGKKVNKNKFKNAYDTKPQSAVAGTKHTITTDEHINTPKKPLKSTFQNPLSRRGETPRGPDGNTVNKWDKQNDQSNN